MYVTEKDVFWDNWKSDFDLVVQASAQVSMTLHHLTS